MFGKKDQDETTPTTSQETQEKRRFTDTVGQSETVLSKGVEIVGDVKGSSNVRLDGVIKGTVDINATLVVAKSGRVEGDVKASNVIIEGQIEGDVKGNDKIELRDGAKVTGNLEAGTIAISEGSFFQGSVSMKSTAKAEPVRFSEKRSGSPEAQAKA